MRSNGDMHSYTQRGRVINVTHLIPFVPMLQRNSSASDGRLRHAWRLKPRGEHSALYSGIRSLNADWDNIVIGFVGEISFCDSDESNGPPTQGSKHLESKEFTDELKDDLRSLLATEKVLPVFLDDAEHRGHYEGYCKTVLWPLFHYILWNTATDGCEEMTNWELYILVNRRFADKIVEVYRPGDMVWIHDYHLLMVPEILRERLPDAPIGLFIHAPFPSSEIFRCLPKREELLSGMLGANQIGFQTYGYARHFISNCTRILGLESTPKGVSINGSVIAVGTFPIGIDANRVESDRKSPGVVSKMAAIKEMYGGKKIIVGRDKLDPVTGILQKLRAFEKFLEEYPEWINQVVLIQVTSPALTESPKLELKVSDLIAHINGKYGSLEFTPVHHYHNHMDQNMDKDEYFALLSIADIGLITSVRDGMNTTSLEYVMCQQENHGPLILSEFTGTAGSLSAAIMVNPWDYAGVAKAINEALNLSQEEKYTKHGLLYSHVTSYTAQNWAKSFISELYANFLSGDQSNHTPYLKLESLLSKYKLAKNRLLLFDYDGTLTPIVRTPSAAVPLPHMLVALEALAADPKNSVWVISGRDQKALDSWLGHVSQLGMSAEHGSFMKYPGSNKWLNLIENIDMSWQHEIKEIFSYYTERTQGSLIEEKRCAITWHYRMADPYYGAFQAKELQNHLESAILPKLPIEILLGKKNLEVRPTMINKGEIVKRLLMNIPDVDFVFCVGDDRTDEDMFRAVRKSDLTDEQCFCTTIGAAKKTMAQWHVGSPNEVIRVMEKMADVSV